MISDALLARLKRDCKPRRGPNPESALTKAIVDALTARGFTAWRNNSGTVKIANCLFRGSPAGSPDVLVILPPYGRLCGFEVKMPGKALRKSQVRWVEKARALGVWVERVESIGSALNIAQIWKLNEANKPRGKYS